MILAVAPADAEGDDAWLYIPETPVGPFIDRAGMEGPMLEEGRSPENVS